MEHNQGPTLPFQNDTIAYVFPGQGSQYVGMVRHLLEHYPLAQQVLQQADDELGYSLTELCLTGPADRLNDTYYSQPAIFATSIAAATVIEEMKSEKGEAPLPAAVTGHSLGLFSALVAAKAIEFAPALHLVQLRGRVMKEAGDKRPGGMAAIIGLAAEHVEDVCREAASTGVIGVANANSPEQIVIAGEVAPLESAMELAKQRGAKRVVRLPISIASHSPLMEEAAEQLAEAITETSFQRPIVPIVNTLDGSFMNDPELIKKVMIDHMCNPVQWITTVQSLVKHGVTATLEIGPGKVLSGLNRRIERRLSLYNTDDLLGQRSERG